MTTLIATYSKKYPWTRPVLDYLQGLPELKSYDIMPDHRSRLQITVCDEEFTHHYGLEERQGHLYLQDWRVSCHIVNMFYLEDLDRHYVLQRIKIKSRRDQGLKHARILMKSLGEVRLFNNDLNVTWYGFRGDPYWKQTIDTQVKPLLGCTLMLGDRWHSPITGLKIHLKTEGIEKYDQRAITLPHPEKIKDYPLLDLKTPYCGGLSEIRKRFREDRPLIDCLELLERTHEQRHTYYQALAVKG